MSWVPSPTHFSVQSGKPGFFPEQNQKTVLFEGIKRKRQEHTINRKYWANLACFLI
jgi:hypothetical protein